MATSEQLRQGIKRELDRSLHNFTLAKNPASSSHLMQAAAIKEYNACGRRLEEAANAMAVKLHEQMSWCQENPHHLKFRAVEEEWFKNLEAYETCCDHAREVTENPMPLPARQGAFPV